MNPLEQELLARLDANRDRSIAFLRDLLRVPSPNPPGDTRAAASFVQHALREAGLQSKVYSPHPEMPNIVSTFDGGSAGRHLVLNGHIDVFPVAEDEWTKAPWGGEIVDGRIYGRGACDMKCGLASITLAFMHLHAVRDRLKGRLTYTAVSDEETFGPWGARWMFENRRDLMMGDCLLSGEPSSPLCVRFGEKSPIWIAIVVRTRGGHGAYTHTSKSATKIAGAIVDALEEVTELSVRAPDNLVAMFRDPGIAAEVDIRLPIGMTRNDMRPIIADILSRFPEATWEELSPPHDAPNWSDPDGEMMQILQNTVVDLGRRRPVPVITLGATDTRLWRYNGVPAYVYGASPETLAAADENVLVEDYLHILRTHVLAAVRYLGST